MSKKMGQRTTKWNISWSDIAKTMNPDSVKASKKLCTRWNHKKAKFYKQQSKIKAYNEGYARWRSSEMYKIRSSYRTLKDRTGLGEDHASNLKKVRAEMTAQDTSSND